MRANTSADGPEDRTFTENARRSQIVRAAIETIGELGYARASFGQIAERAGLSSTGMISYHFNGKTDLITEVVTQVLADSAAYMRSRIEAVEGSAARLRAYIESNLEFIAGHPAEIAAITQIVQHGLAGHPDAAGTNTWYESSIDVLRQRLVAGQLAGDFGEFDARVMAIAIRQVIDGMPTELAEHPETDPGTYIAEVVRIFERATSR